MEDARSLIDESGEARRRGDRATAIELATKAVDVSRAANDAEALGAALAALGRLRRDEHDLAAALELYEQSAAIARNTSDGLALAHRLRHIGDIALEQGDLKRADECFREAEVLLESCDTGQLQRANFLRSKALLREKQDRSAEAARLWSEARALYAATGVDDGVRESDRRLQKLRA